MGTSLRIFLVNDDDYLKRLPLAKFERLSIGDPKELSAWHLKESMESIKIQYPGMYFALFVEC